MKAWTGPTILCLLLTAMAPVAAAGGSQSVTEAKRILIEKTLAYQARIEAQLPILEASLVKERERVERLRPLLEKGYIARSEFDRARQQCSEAERLLELRGGELETARQIVVEARAELAQGLRQEDLGAATRAVEAVVRFRGSARWTLAESVAVANFFWNRFGRELPISAYGQTPTHDALGFDHRDQLDVAINPKSPEGQVLMEFLKSSSISFVGFSGAVEGTATGAHIHVGNPSPRLF